MKLHLPMGEKKYNCTYKRLLLMNFTFTLPEWTLIVLSNKKLIPGN